MKDKGIFTDKQKRTWHLMERDDNSIVLYYTLPDSPGHWVVWDSLDNPETPPFVIDTEELMLWQI